MATQADLEAVIDGSPDDVDAYLVYGDWLAGQGDPRGELIALQAAIHRDPTDRKLEQRAAKHLEEHADALCGAWRTRHRDELALTWRHGFIRDVRVALWGTELLDVLRELIRHPSGRFLQSITFGRDVDADAIVELLLAERRPVTLAELRLIELADAHVEKLRGVFPRLHRSLAIEWRTVLEEIDGQRRLDVRLDASAMPPLQSIDGTSYDVPTDKLLKGMRLELDKHRGPGIVGVMRRTFTADSLDRFVVAMGREHVAHGGATTRWVWNAVGALGGQHAATWIGESIFGWQYRALHAIDVLGQMRSEHAVLELAAIASDPRHEAGHRGHAAAVLRAIAGQRDVDELVDRSIPAQLERRGRDAVLRRLCAQMIDGRRLSPPTFRHHLASHPAVAPLAARVVWAIYDGRAVRTTFRLAGDQPVDLDDVPVDLDGAIGILHPAELPADRRTAIVRAWRDAFEQLAISPLFPQLERPVRTLEPHEHGSQLARFADRRVGLDRLRAVLQHQRGWEERHAYPTFEGWERRFARDSVLAIASCDGTAITSVHAVVGSGAGSVALEALHPVTLSELLDDLETATTVLATTAAAADLPIAKGTRVQIVRGANRGKHGVVFWLDGANATRCGVRGDDGETYWASLEMVVIEGAPEPADGEPWFDRGARVRWKKGRQTGTGSVFWTGKNKFGDGMRLGIKDDATGETVWASAKDCAAAEDA